MLPKNVAFMSFELQTFIRGWIPNFIDLFEKYITLNFELWSEEQAGSAFCIED